MLAVTMRAEVIAMQLTGVQRKMLQILVAQCRKLCRILLCKTFWESNFNRSREELDLYQESTQRVFIPVPRAQVGRQLSSILERRRLSLESNMDAVISGYRYFRDLRPHVVGFVDKDSMPGGSTFILVSQAGEIKLALGM
jgi:hypothetical protein